MATRTFRLDDLERALATNASVAACLRKIRHRTQSKALVAAARAAGQHGTKALRVYRCPHCRGWHMTHQARARG